MKIKWTTKYVKLTLKNIDHPWYIPEKNKRYGIGNVWYIVKEIKPGVWKEVMVSPIVTSDSSPSPLDICSGNKPNLDFFDYEELTEKEAFIEML